MITGGCGFLGKHLLKLLLEKEDELVEVRVFDKHIDSDLNAFSTGKTSSGLSDHSALLFIFKRRHRAAVCD